MDYVAIEPLGKAWAVHLSGVENPMLFSSRRGAAGTVRLLTDRLAAAGQPVSVHLWPTGGSFSSSAEGALL